MENRALLFDVNGTLIDIETDEWMEEAYRAVAHFLTYQGIALHRGEVRDVIQKMRPVLEAYCRNLYPTQFGEQEMMGSIITKIRTAGAHPLFAIVDDLDELNVYCRRYHHGENPNAATEPVDDAELQGYVKRTLKLVGCLLYLTYARGQRAEDILSVRNALGTPEYGEKAMA